MIANKPTEIEVDFQPLSDSVEIITRDIDYYKKIRTKLWNSFTENELKRIDRVINNIQNFADFEKELIDLIEKRRKLCM